jgi:hypothetical protein
MLSNLFQFFVRNHPTIWRHITNAFKKAPLTVLVPTFEELTDQKIYVKILYFSFLISISVQFLKFKFFSNISATVGVYFHLYHQEEVACNSLKWRTCRIEKHRSDRRWHPMQQNVDLIDIDILKVTFPCDKSIMHSSAIDDSAKKLRNVIVSLGVAGLNCKLRERPTCC